ncbi:MAG: c-type cytochrome [Chthoniobacteraceae bacterium]
MFRPLPHLFVVITTVIASWSSSAFAQGKKKGELPPRTDEQILQTVKLPAGYEATVFASPPQLGYPTSVSAAIDGTIFVAVDENGSLGRARNEAGKPRGYVMRLRDTDGDGKADEFKRFCEVESPRGVIWDGPSGTAPGTLYVMHPPNLTAYTDTDGDGTADKQEDILTGLGFDLDFRGADHTTNGCRLGIDGFIYIAMGDYGSIGAKGKDGRTLTHRGGGIVRIRPDGTGLELVAEGTRNIYDVAISPTMDLFTRDNTNDGGGWDVRLSFVPPGAHMGYPTLFKNFSEDMLQPMADYGGGSPCGALWIDEPGLQNGLYTVEWGRNAIMYHHLKQKGAGWESEGPNQGQEEWLKLTRPTDMDVDASGAIFITSWEGATFDYNGPNAGYVLRVTKKDKPKVEVPDLAKALPGDLLGLFDSPSAVIRLAAKRRLVGEIDTNADAGEFDGLIEGLQRIVLHNPSLLSRIVGLATLSQTGGALFPLAGGGVPSTGAEATLKDISPDLREHAIRFIGESAASSQNGGLGFAIEGLKDRDIRVRAAAITALRRLVQSNAASSILPLVADSDLVVSHLAVRALTELKAAEPCLAALDSSDEAVAAGALRALYGVYDSAVVDGLLARLSSAKGERRRGILNALCRLANQDAEYTNPKVWWGTRPDTSGPVYQPVKWAESGKIEGALKKELEGANDEDALWLAQRMVLTKVDLPNLSSVMLSKAKDAPAKLAAIEAITRTKPGLSDEAIAVLLAIISDEKQSPELRANALREIQRSSDWERELDAGATALAPFLAHPPANAPLATAVNDYTHDAKLVKLSRELGKIANDSDPGKRAVANTILINLASSGVVKGKDRDAIDKEVNALWQKPQTAAGLLGAIARTKAPGFDEEIRKHLTDPNNAVSEAALFAFQALGLSNTDQPMKTIGDMKVEMVAAIVNKGGGDAAAGKEMFLRAGCIACHTVTAEEPLKGPILSAAAKIYDRAALTESILKPNAKVAQGFESVFVKTKKGDQVEGFVTREGGDSVDLRNVAGQTVTIEKGDIAERGAREQSMMPEGLLNAFSPTDLANLLAYIESLKGS